MQNQGRVESKEAQRELKHDPSEINQSHEKSGQGSISQASNTDRHQEYRCLTPLLLDWLPEMDSLQGCLLRNHNRWSTSLHLEIMEGVVGGVEPASHGRREWALGCCWRPAGSEQTPVGLSLEWETVGLARGAIGVLGA